MNDYVIELVQESYTPGVGGIYILYNEKTKKVTITHICKDDAWALNELLPYIHDKDYTYTLYGAQYYDL